MTRTETIQNLGPSTNTEGPRGKTDQLICYQSGDMTIDPILVSVVRVTAMTASEAVERYPKPEDARLA